jgi:ABC-2 type transport system ATP-binding protein
MSITITGLSKLYGKFKALSEIDLNIRTGQSVGLVGLNGAGKTTLLKTIVGLIVNFDGEVLINNQAVNDRDAKSNISFLPEDFSPLYLTGYGFVSYMLRLYGRGFNRDEVDAFAHTLELQKNILSQPIGTYSKGMRQKLGLLAAMLPDTGSSRMTISYLRLISEKGIFKCLRRRTLLKRFFYHACS